MRMACYLYGLLLSLLWLGLTPVVAHAQEVEWLKVQRMSDEMAGDFRSVDITVDDNNIYIIGRFVGSMQIGSSTFVSAGDTDIFFAKYDLQGNSIWARQLGGQGFDTPMSLQVDGNDNVYVSGTFFNSAIDFGSIILGPTEPQHSEGFIAKYDINGNFLWAEHLDSTGGHVGPVKFGIDENGNVYSYGAFTDNAQIGNESLIGTGDYDLFIAKFNTNGESVWVKQISGEQVVLEGLHVEGDSLYFAGYFSSEFTLDSTTLTSAGGQDILLARYDSDGVLQWAINAGGPEHESAYDVTVDNSGHIYLVGAFFNSLTFGSQTYSGQSSDGFLAKVDSTGTPLWAQTFGGQFMDSSWEVTVDNNDDIFVAMEADRGLTTFNQQVQYDKRPRFIVTRYDSEGNVIWIVPTTSSQVVQGSGIAAGDNGRLYVMGEYMNSMTFGDITLTAGGSNQEIFFGALLTSSPNDPIFADGFEGGNFSAWTNYSSDSGDLAVTQEAALVGEHGLQLVLNDNTSIGMRDEVPNGEERYRARFYFDPNSIPMGDGEHHVIFFGYSGTDLTRPVLRVEFGYLTPNYRVRIAYFNDNNNWFVGGWKTISDEPHVIEVDWQAATAPGADDGWVSMWIDGTLQAHKVTIDNDTMRIDTTRLGAVAGIDNETRGTYYMDAFESRRLTYIGADPAASVAMAAPAAVDEAALNEWHEVTLDDPDEAALMEEVLEYAEQQQAQPQLFLPWLGD